MLRLPCLIVVPCSGAPSRSSPPHKGGGKLTLRDRYFSYIYSTYHQQVLQEKRGRNDIWRGLYQFPLFESDSPQTPEAVAHWVEDALSYSGGRLVPTTFSLEHRLSHQILHITIYTAELESDAVGSTKYQWVNRSELGDYALPMPLVRFLEQLHWRNLSPPRRGPIYPWLSSHPPSLGGYARIRGVFTIFDRGVARLRSGSTPLRTLYYRQVETMAEQETPQFNIELPEEVGQGQYANLAVVLHSQSEFILDFVRLLPGQQSARVHSRQILTPDNAKRLVRLLEQHLAGFEQEYGKIELPEDGAVEVNAN